MRDILLIGFITLLIGCDPAKELVRYEYEDHGESSQPLNELLGSWETTFINDSTGIEIAAVAIVTDGYFSDAWYNLEEKVFVGTFGGSWKLEENEVALTFEFNTIDSTQVGKTVSRDYKIENDVITFLPQNEKWTRIDNGTPGALANAWLITGRMRNGKMSSFSPGVRKTMKILSGTRFQWIAYNTATSEFFGTGGGTYSTQDGKYIENIEFFSRNADRIGASLEFNFKLNEGDWQHSGLSSRGDPINEIWTPRTTLDKLEGK